MDSVGDVSDGDFVFRPAREQRLKKAPADLAVQTAYTIHRPAPANRQIGHVEWLRRVGRVLAAKGQQVWQCDTELFFGVPCQVLRDEGGGETVKTGSHRRVGGEEVTRPSYGEGNFERMPALLHEIAGAFQNSEGRMAFVQVTDLRLEPKRTKQAPSTDSQEHFLLEAQLRPASIELAGDPAMSGIVGRVVAVQQIKIHPANLYLPGAQPYGVSRQRDFQPQPLPVRLPQRRDRQLSRIVERVESLLLSVIADHLAKVTLLVKQSHAGHGHTQIAGGFELIASHIAQPP